MIAQFIPTKSESVGLDDLQSDFLSLRVGEIIPRLEIKTIRKLTNPSKTDNLPGVDYKYLIENAKEEYTQDCHKKMERCKKLINEVSESQANQKVKRSMLIRIEDCRRQVEKVQDEMDEMFKKYS